MYRIPCLSLCCNIFCIKEFFHIGKQSFKQILIYQLSANLILALVWLLYTSIADGNCSAWGFRRFLVILISSIHDTYRSGIRNFAISSYIFGSASLPILYYKMKFFEKYFPETRRFRIFAWIYLVFFTTLLALFVRQVIQREDYVEKEKTGTA